MHQEHHIVPTLQCSDSFAEIIFAVHRFAVDFKDHVALAQAYVLIGKRARLHILDHDAFSRRHLQLLCHFGSETFYRNTQLRFSRLSIVVLRLFIATQTPAVEFGAVSDSKGRCVFLAVADITNFGLIARLQVRNFIHQFVAVFHWRAIHGNDGVASLDSYLVGRTAGSHIRDRDP